MGSRSLTLHSLLFTIKKRFLVSSFCYGALIIGCKPPISDCSATGSPQYLREGIINKVKVINLRTLFVSCVFFCVQHQANRC